MAISESLKTRIASAMRTREDATELITALDAEAAKVAAKVVKLNQTIGASYVQADVQAISTKVDAIITALTNAKLMVP